MRRLTRTIVATIGVMVLLVACSDNKDTVKTRSKGGSTAGKKTIGFSEPTAQNQFIRALDTTFRIEFGNEGWSYKSLDAQLDPNKQISDVDSLVSEGADAIIIWPNDSKSVKPALDRAKAAGIKIFALYYESDYNGRAPSPPVDGQVLDGRAQMAAQQAAFVNKKLHGKGNIVYIDLAVPVAAIDFLRDSFLKDIKRYPGIKVVEVVSNPTDDAAGARPLADAMLSKYPDLKAIVGYHGPTAVGASLAATAAKRRQGLLITGTECQEPECTDGLAKRQYDADWDSQAVVMARDLSDMTVAALTGKESKLWHKTVVVPPKMYTPETITNRPSWKSQQDALRKG